MLPAGPGVKMCRDELFEKAAKEANKCRRPKMTAIREKCGSALSYF